MTHDSKPERLPTPIDFGDPKDWPSRCGWAERYLTMIGEKDKAGNYVVDLSWLSRGVEPTKAR